MFQEYFQSSSRFNNVIVRSSTSNGNVLVKEALADAMAMHLEIESTVANVAKEEGGEEMPYTFLDLCTPAGGACTDFSLGGVCNCLISSILKLWNYDLDTLLNDADVLGTINSSPFYTKEELENILGKPVFDSDGNLVSAEAFSISYFIKDRNEEGTDADPINEGWEEKVFLKVVDESVDENYELLETDYFAGRSFSDEFGGAITGDLLLVQISYAIVFIFLGGTYCFIYSCFLFLKIWLMLGWCER